MPESTEGPQEASNAVTYGCVGLFGVPFAFMGITAIVGAVRSGQYVPIVFGVAMLVAAALPLFAAHMAIKYAPTRRKIYQELRAIPAAEKPEWRSGRLPDKSQTDTFASTTGIVILAVLSVIFGFVVVQALRLREWAGLIFLAVPLITVSVLISIVRTRMRKKRFGTSELVLQGSRGHVGEALKASLVIERLARESMAGTAFRMRVSCLRKQQWQEGSGSKRRTRTSTSTLWTEESQVQAHAVQGHNQGVSVPVSIDIPADQQPTNDAMPNDIVYWQMEVWAELAGIDYYSRFEVPVYAAN